MSGWGGLGGGGGSNMDATLLAQTMINLAQNMLTTQNVNQQQQQFQQQQQQHYSGRTGLLGAGPDNNINQQQQQQRGFQQRQQRQQHQQQGHTTWHSGKPDKERNNKRGGSSSASRVDNRKNNKNYLPKIKEEGCKPHYYDQEYDSLAGKYLQCTLCKKDPMWNGSSFVKHLLGGPHSKAVETLIEEDVARVAKLRKLMAELVKSNNETGSDKCGMCDVKVQDITTHRRDDFHIQLRKFIHPHCEPCGADFEDRSDWYYHSFSAYHLTNLENRGKKVDYSPLRSSSIDFVISKMESKLNINSSPTKKEQDNDEVIVMDDDEDEKDEAKMKDENNVENLDVVGREYIEPVNGLYCKLCKKFFMSEKSEIQAHCSSTQHVDSVTMIEKQTGIKRKTAGEFFVQPKKSK